MKLNSLVKIFLCLLVFLSGCIPGTYYDPVDPYVRGLRSYDRAVEATEKGDLEQANFWLVSATKVWRSLAERGDCDAQFRYGTLFLLQGVHIGEELAEIIDPVAKKSREEWHKTGLEWWKRAANQGQPKAQFVLGDVYYQNIQHTAFQCRSESCGKMIGRDLVKAYVWYRLGEQSAVYKREKVYIADILSKIRSEMTSEQIKKGDIEVSEWKPTPQKCKPRELW